MITQRTMMMAAWVALSQPVLVQPLSAETLAAQDGANGRYSMSQTPDGYLKLDSRTGEVTECRRTGDQGYRCTLTPDERAALQAEIDRLAAENARLKLATQSPGTTPPAAGPGAVPSDQDIDRAMTVMERFMRRFMALMKEEQAKPPASP